MAHQHFHDRRDAGRQLATRLSKYANRNDVVVLALPRGGVPVGFEVARALGAPLDVFLVRKLGVPFHPELAMGAIASGGVRVLNDHVVEALGLTAQIVEEIASIEAVELERREQEYRADRGLLDVRGRTAIVIDDGLATGASMRAAIVALRKLGPDRIVVAVPVASPETCHALGREVDDMVCAYMPLELHAVGIWYEDFSQTSDAEVRTLLKESTGKPSHVTGGLLETEVRVFAGTTALGGTLAIPPDARGLVLFAHGSGSSRFSTRNRAVAESLRVAGLATLLVDLLTLREAQIDEVTSSLRFDVDMLGARVAAVVDWLRSDPRTNALPIGIFGASTGAAAALIAAAQRTSVAAVVSRGGRPDLAGPALARVQAPTLFIVGSRDEMVLQLNRDALDRIDAPKALMVVPGATHLFEESGTLEQVAQLAADWFSRHLAGTRVERDSLSL